MVVCLRRRRFTFMTQSKSANYSCRQCLELISAVQHATLQFKYSSVTAKLCMTNRATLALLSGMIDMDHRCKVLSWLKTDLLLERVLNLDPPNLLRYRLRRFWLWFVLFGPAQLYDSFFSMVCSTRGIHYQRQITRPESRCKALSD